MQFQVINSPFNQEQVDLLNRLVPTLTENQKSWLSGYLAISQSATVSEAAATTEQEAPVAVVSSENTAKKEKREVTVLYGTDTGNSQNLAEEFTQKLEQEKFKVTLSSMDDFKPKSIKSVQDLLIVTSTDGDGDPPDNALSFYEFLYSKRAPKLGGVRFSVLALGDSSYEFYCQTGKDFDARLEELGGERIHPRVDCDLDFEEPAEEWFEGVFAKLNENNGESEQGQSSAGTVTETIEGQVTYSRSNPFRAEILESLNLNGRGSNKETRHLELDLEGSNLYYQPGDSLGIFPENDPELVNELIEEMDWNPDESVQVNKQGDILSLREALTSNFEITTLTKPFLEKAVALTANNSFKKLIDSDNREEINAYLDGRDLLDLVRDYGPWEATAQDFVNILRKIPVRLYSIASSLKANPDEVHLTIGTVRYQAHGRDRKGVCSGQCAERTEIGDKLSVFVQRNDSFRLPENPDTPVIMIGAGTGVAPYRSFLEEREELDIQGKSWLFFGDQHFVTDFLYQTEWQKWLDDGVLTKMDVAFSRDTAEKVYVQHKMKEKGKELYQWLVEGAHVYVCGDEKLMAKDVQSTLLEIIETEGGLSPEEAEEYLTEMRKQKRYQRDVY
ncbi:assimilatory sulfite reductase (NADPH) flavoprotein subunit [Aquibacillus rhizosphaerae]|uniref:Assimilatory sulfite reductase (NADPH) flavoprotein subunit n=1 Tax=Aquibacillus rhizosphaerae TaxID=3051431 RepID=A0ABT7LBP1_9BACI|nr:assimilatory sulfite reductase (NADPH) flavoprotein subunit [Aquibacillus sp. LR5S19]MDL4842692.1 assimilatory sulfite reductase (NADPH) flavoprotein subunit [Aquibacillus sp. LR5S19]